MNVLIAPGMLPAHVMPYLEAARLLRKAGHEVSFYTEAYAKGWVERTGATFIESAAPRATEVFLRRPSLAGQTQAARAFTEAVGLDLARRLRRLRIQVGLVDQMCCGGALALEAAGVPWASLAISPAILNPRLDDWPSRIPTRALRQRLGLPPSEENSLEQAISPSLFLLPWVPELNMFPAPPQARFVGSVYGTEHPAPELREWLGATATPPRVLVSLSTAPDVQVRKRTYRLLRMLCEALGRLDVKAVVTVGNVERVALPRRVAPNVRLERFVDHSAVVDRIDCVVNQGGWGTISRALPVGAAMLVIPFERDQPMNAALCQTTGLALCARDGELSVPTLTDSLRYLASPTNLFRLRAQRQVPAWQKAGGAPALVRHVLALGRR